MTDTQPQEEFQEQDVTYLAEVDGRIIAIEGVPARVSLLIGERLYAPETVERIQAIVWGELPPRAVSFSLGGRGWHGEKLGLLPVFHNAASGAICCAAVHRPGPEGAQQESPGQRPGY